LRACGDGWRSPRRERDRSSSPYGEAGDFAAVACNTAHLFLARVRDESPLPIISLIEVTAGEAARIAPGGSVGLLATSGTLRSRLYHDPLEARGLRAVSPFDLDGGETLQRRNVMEPIYGPWVDGRHRGGGIKTDGGSARARTLLEEAAGRLVADGGAEVLVAARNPVQRAEAEVTGAEAVPLDQLPQHAHRLDMLLSTVPVPVVGKDVLDALPSRSLVMDLAAPPGGVDLDRAAELGHITSWARGLGARAPVTAGASQWDGIRKRIERIEGVA